MLTKSNFREPLERHLVESDISLFLRHTRACHDVHVMLSKLERFCIQEEIPSLSDAYLFLDLAKKFIRRPCSRPLERRLINLCGKCSGKVFKYFKGLKDDVGIDKARLTMQLVLVREYNVRSEEESRFLDSGRIPPSLYVLREILRRRRCGSLYAHEDGGCLMTESSCTNSILIEDEV